MTCTTVKISIFQLSIGFFYDISNIMEHISEKKILSYVFVISQIGHFKGKILYDIK